MFFVKEKSYNIYEQSSNMYFPCKSYFISNIEEKFFSFSFPGTLSPSLVTPNLYAIIVHQTPPLYRSYLFSFFSLLSFFSFPLRVSKKKKRFRKMKTFRDCFQQLQTRISLLISFFKFGDGPHEEEDKEKPG